MIRGAKNLFQLRLKKVKKDMSALWFLVQTIAIFFVIFSLWWFTMADDDDTRQQTTSKVVVDGIDCGGACWVVVLLIDRGP